MKFDDVKKLHQKKYRHEFGYFLLEGEHLVLELQKAMGGNPLLGACQLYVTEVYAGWQKSSIKTHVISERQMELIAATKTPQGIVAIVPLLTAAPPHADERTIYLHEIQDPGNLGTILRTLAWFGNFRCLLSPNSVDPYNDKAVRASMGAILQVPIEIDVPLENLPTRFSRIACLDVQGKKIQDEAFKAYDCYLFGNEARGVPRGRIADLNIDTFTISGGGEIESLNLATSVNICVYELVR